MQPPAAVASLLPANQPPLRAKVIWDRRGLEIDASNSSLDQILRQVAAATGARLEGLAGDQRIFGIYGPGPGCVVLSRLLEGSGYNLLLVSSHDSGAPLLISLSIRLPAQPQTAQDRHAVDSVQNDPERSPESDPRPDDTSASTELPRPQNPFSKGQPATDPIQFMDEVLHRQQQIDQQTSTQQTNAQQP